MNWSRRDFLAFGVAAGATILLPTPADALPARVAIQPGAPWCTAQWPYRMKTFIQHVHTTHSTPDNFQSGSMDPREADHAFAPDQNRALEACERLGVDLLGLSDHGENLDLGVWLLEGNDLTRRAQGSTVPLRGFEWTSGGVFGGGGVEHINVYNTTDYAGTASHASNWHGTKLPTLRDLYRWLSRQPDLWIGVFCHPWLAKNPFDDFVNPGLSNVRHRMALIEVGGGEDPRYREDLARGERFYLQALQCGWRVAPCYGVDNFASPFQNATIARNHTSCVWHLKEQGWSRSQAVNDLFNRRLVARTEPWDVRFAICGTGQWLTMGDRFKSRPSKVTSEIRVAGRHIGPYQSVKLEMVLVSRTEVARVAVPARYLQRTGGNIIGGEITLAATITFEPSPDTVCCYLALRHQTRTVALTAPIWFEKYAGPR